MQSIDLSALKAGYQLPPHSIAPISRHTLAMFAGGSADHNPIHVDIDFAKKAGMPDVFAHGMLSMAYLAQFLTRLLPQDRIREFGVRFAAITPVGAAVMCTGSVTEIFVQDGERLARLDLEATVDGGTRTLQGDAIVALD